MSAVNLFWFRRDLRLEDNAGLFHALKAGIPVVPIFIFDRLILDEIEDKEDRRVSFIHQSVEELQSKIIKTGGSMDVRYGSPIDVFKQLCLEFEINAVFTNHDYEPYATSRDEQVRQLLATYQIKFETFKDQVVFEKNEIVKEDDVPYSVFTPYSKKWISQLDEKKLLPFNTATFFKNFKNWPGKNIPSLKEMGFKNSPNQYGRFDVDEGIISNYQQTRNIPGIPGTSRQGVHLRFGTISIRQLVAKSLELNRVYVNELIWREFFMQLLWQQPRLVTESCKREFDHIQWRNHEDEYERWCTGTTGYPIVDAGMRELNETGFMHNRVRMITASFLVKHLLIDWRWGESYFSNKLMDYELASNNGNWQWVAGCGCDAAPYFRIFSPSLQAQKFDSKLLYINKWVPELNSFSYPKPMVDHDQARQRCLMVYKAGIDSVKNG